MIHLTKIIARLAIQKKINEYTVMLNAESPWSGDDTRAMSYYRAIHRLEDLKEKYK